MSLLPAPLLPESFIPYQEVRDHFGFVPAVLRAQSQLPRLIEAEVRICIAILATPGALTREQKERILLPGGIHRGGLDALHAHGFTDAHVLEAILTTALARFLSTASVGLNVERDFGSHVDCDWAIAGPGLQQVDRHAEVPAFEFFRNTFGFVPNLFRAQTLRPDVLEAEASAIETLLLTTDVLSRVQKESIVIAVSAANLNAYCVALHCEALRTLGIDEDTSDGIAVDHQQSDLSAADKALIDFALRVAREIPAEPRDVERLRSHGFSDRHVLEAVAVAALTNFLNTLQSGLGTVPDFAPRRHLAATPKPSPAGVHPQDPDVQLVDRARKGDVAAFEKLVRQHHRRIFRAALGVTGNYEDAEDVAQIAFVKAFQSLSTFERHARFTTWLTRIAINEALSRVRARRPMETLSLEADDRSDFKPAIIGSWVDNPEQVYAREELRSLIERALADIPVKYRLPVLLRDVEQLSTAEAASALGLAVPTLKKHLLRGRLLLREALAPHFLSGQGAVARV